MKLIEVKALQLASRFSLPPNSKGYCGRDSAPARFKRCLLHGDCKDVPEELTKFIVLTPYLNTLAEVTGLPQTDYKLIESYWIGNDLLRKANNKHFNLLLKNFLKQGVPDWYVDELKENKPKKFIPIHQFQVFHVGVGKASGSIPHNLESSNNCMIRWGRVLRATKTTAEVSLNILKIIDGKYVLEDTAKPETLKIDKILTPKLNVDDIVAVHWQQIIKILTPIELYNLNYWTNEVLKTVNPPVFKKRDSKPRKISK